MSDEKKPESKTPKIGERPSVPLECGVMQKQVYSFDGFGKKWDCLYMKEGDRLDEAAYESSFEKRVKVKCFEIIEEQRADWRKLTGKDGCGIIFDANNCVA